VIPVVMQTSQLPLAAVASNL